MVFINEDTLEEVASFHLTKRSLYTLFSTIFFVTILATVCVLLFTPLKYYIPGYGSNAVRVQAMALERKVDSLTALATLEARHAERIHALISGKDTARRDTTLLSADLINAAPQSVLPDPDDIRAQAGVAVKKATVRHGRRKK